MLNNPMDTLNENHDRWNNAKNYIKQNGIEIKYASELEYENDHNITR